VHTLDCGRIGIRESPESDVTVFGYMAAWSQPEAVPPLRPAAMEGSHVDDGFSVSKECRWATNISEASCLLEAGLSV
jgi:hypothetical protein